MAEVLLWRVGALFYMYGHTVVNDAARISSLKKECLDRGISNLVTMLSMRSAVPGDPFERPPPPQSPEDKHQVEQFMREGIMSDTHLLALAYCGEMAYWQWKLFAKGTDDAAHARDVAIKALKKYIRVVHELLDAMQQHWDTSRPFQMLQELC
eukprot:Opistho-2@23898